MMLTVVIYAFVLSLDHSASLPRRKGKKERKYFDAYVDE